MRHHTHLTLEEREKNMCMCRLGKSFSKIALGSTEMTPSSREKSRAIPAFDSAAPQAYKSNAAKEGLDANDTIFSMIKRSFSW